MLDCISFVGKGPAISNITPLQSKGRRRQCNHRCINKTVDPLDTGEIDYSNITNCI